MYKLDNFKTCCDYLGIDNTLPVCQIDERKIQAAYKLRVCMKAWNRQDGFVPDEIADWKSDNVGFTPHFCLKKGKLLSSGLAFNDSTAGIIAAYANLSDTSTLAYFGLRLCFKTQERAVEFSETFIEIFMINIRYGWLARMRVGPNGTI